MRIGRCAAISLCAGILLLTVTGLAQSPAPWRTTEISRLSYREWHGTPCGRASGRHHYHQFRNNSSGSLNFFAAFTYRDGEGTEAKASNFHSLDAGRETSSSASELCVIPGSVKVQVTLATPEGRPRSAFIGNAVVR